MTGPSTYVRNLPSESSWPVLLQSQIISHEILGARFHHAAATVIIGAQLSDYTSFSGRTFCHEIIARQRQSLVYFSTTFVRF